MKKYAVVRKESGIVYYEWFKELADAVIDSFCSKTTAMAFFKSAKKQGKSPIMLTCGRYDGGYAICYAIDRAKALGCICKSSFEEFHCEE